MVLAILVADVVSLAALVSYGDHFWMGDPVLVLSLATIGFLVYLARRAPSGERLATTASPLVSPRRMAVTGIAFYPSVLLTESLLMGVGAPALVDFLMVVFVQGLFLVYVLRVVGSFDNEPQVIALAFGLILPIAAIGLIATIAAPAAILGDLVMVLFFRMLWRRYRVRTLAVSEPVPSGTGKDSSQDEREDPRLRGG
jgi:hypothetical protein